MGWEIEKARKRDHFSLDPFNPYEDQKALGALSDMAKLQQMQEEQRRLYTDVVIPYETQKVELATPSSVHWPERNRKLGQGQFIDQIVPYDLSYNPEKYTLKTAGAPLKIALEEQPKAPFPLEASGIGLKSLSFDSLSADPFPIESKKLSTEEKNSSKSIFQRFADWLVGLFAGKNDSQVEEDTGISKKKLESPAIRNIAAMRDCLKRLNQSLEKMKDLVQTDTASGPTVDAELATMYLLLIDVIKKSEITKKMQIMDANNDMQVAQKAYKEAQKKYFEALNETLSLSKFIKWMKPIDALSTAAIVTAFGIAGAAIVVGFATGGLAAVAGAFGAVAGIFGILQAIGYLGKGTSQVVSGVVKYKTDTHHATMIESREEQDLLNFTMEEDMKFIQDMMTEMSGMWKRLMTVQAGRQETVGLIKN